ncbi:MAG: 30S ribosomal protein S2 [Bacteroidetes bacterium]|nr:30S ribosomal protein S2 [Bacteroidota bacterium]
MSSEAQTDAVAHRASIEDLLQAGTHFGHLTSRWNPKMKHYVFMERNGIHIIDLTKSQTMLDAAADAAARFARQGKSILFAGTKKQAREILRKHAEACDTPYVVERWLGGTLTNFQTIRKSIRRMEDLVKMEEDGTLAQLKKKERLMRAREREKLEKVLMGISNMARLPGALFIVDINREHIAVKEARKLGIPIIAMVDTNCDPDLVNFPVPSNDDALKSIDLIAGVISNAIAEGKKQRESQAAEEKAAQQRHAEEKEAQEEGAKPKKTRRTKKEASADSGSSDDEGADESKQVAAAKKSAPAEETAESAEADSDASEESED